MKQQKLKPGNKKIPQKAIPGSPPERLIHWPYGQWIATGLTFFISLFIFRDYIFGNAYYLFYDIGSDTMTSFYPTMVHATRYIATEGFPMWSFAEGMGQNILSTSLMSPFNWIAYLAGTENPAGIIIWLELIKILLTSIVVYRLIVFWTKSTLVNITGTLLYCFSGFMIVGSSWYVFSTEAFLLSLFLLAFEELYSRNKWYLFPISVALICINLPVNLYMFGLFLLFYMLFRHYTSAHPQTRKLVAVTLKMVGYGAVGALISSVIFISNMFLLLDSPRLGQGYGYFDQLFSRSIFFLESPLYYTTGIFRFLSSNLLGTGMHFRGWNNYLEAPLWYIGLVPLLLTPQVFIFPGKRKKIAWALLLTLVAIPVIFPFFRNAFWLFSGDYFRVFSFMVALVILMAGMQSLDQADRGIRLNIFLLAGTAVILILLLYFPFEKEAEAAIDKDIRAMARNLLVLFTIILFLFRYTRYRLLIRIVFLLAICVELAYQGNHITGHRIAFTRDNFKSKLAYNDYTVEALKYIRQREKPFYRIVKSFFSVAKPHSSLNDAKTQGYFGSPCYSSFNQKYYIRFQEEVGIITKGNENQSRWSMGVMGRPLLWGLTSAKYFLSKYPPEDSQNNFPAFIPEKKFGDIWVYRNKAFLPLGFVYSTYMTEEYFSELSSIQKERYLLKTAAIRGQDSVLLPDMQRVVPGDTSIPYMMSEYFKDVSELQKDTMELTGFSENHIRGTIHLGRSGLLFFSIPFDEGWKAHIDAAEAIPVLSNFGFTGYYLEPGDHIIALDYTPPWFYESIAGSLAGLIIYAALIVIPWLRQRKRRESIHFHR